MAKTSPASTDKTPEPSTPEAMIDDDLMAKANQELARDIGDVPPPYPRDEAERLADRARYGVMDTAHSFAHAILKNPAAERFLYGNPLDAARKCGEESSVGAFLARRCAVLAQDFRETLEAIGEEAYQATLAAERAKRGETPTPDA